jgi:hypothetical protein
LAGSIKTLRRYVPASTAKARGHDSLREGAALGLVVATVTWLWLALVDAVAGEPFLTFTVFGGIIAFTVVHYLLNIFYGLAIMSGIHGAVHAPSLIFGIGFGLLMLEFAFALLSAALWHSPLGTLAWLRIFGGSVIGATVAFLVIARRHPLAELLHQAEDER